jgi:integrase
LSEALKAERGDITSNGIRIRGGKSEKAKRVVPVLFPAWPLLAFAMTHADGDPHMFTPWINLRRDITKACAKAGIPVFTPNDHRRTTATWLVKRGVPLNLIAKVLGHASTAMLERAYGQLDSHDVGRLIEMHVAS